MSTGYFDRLPNTVNLRRMQRSLVVVVGIGAVGSQVTMELARCGVGRFRLIDGDVLEESNRPRHVLPRGYVGRNKATAMKQYLDSEVPGSHSEAESRYVNETVSDAELDDLLRDADLIVAATDDREAQRRVGRRALAVGVPAIFPALYRDGGGEVIVQLDPQFPCFFCWDGFRDNEQQLREVRALNAIAQPIIRWATLISLAVLDPSSEHRRLLAAGRGQPPRQIFVDIPTQPLLMAPLLRRPDCPSCRVGPAPPPPFTSPLPPQSRPRLATMIALSAVIVVVIALVIGVASGNSPSPSLKLPRPSVPESVATASGGVTATQSGQTSESGTSVATAIMIQPGEPEEGNSGTVAYGEGSCGPEDGQFWKVQLAKGEFVKIVWGGPDDHAMGLDIWPPGITDIHGSDRRRLTYQSTEGEESEWTFTAPTAGEYPVVFDDSCGNPGMFHFTLTTQPG
jgi:hypothetical protein